MLSLAWWFWVLEKQKQNKTKQNKQTKKQKNHGEEAKKQQIPMASEPA